MLMLAWRLFLKDKGGKQDSLIPFVGSNLVVETLENEGTSENDALKIRIEAPLCILCRGFKKILCKACLLFNCFLVIKGILKALFSFIPWVLNFSYLQIWGKYIH